MKHLKRLLFLPFLFCLIFGLCALSACGKEETPENQGQTEDPNKEEEKPDKKDDKEEEVKISYKIAVNRANGKSFSKKPFITVYDANGKQVRSAQLTADKNDYASVDVKLPIGEYTVKLTGIPNGFEYEDSYTISAEHSTLDLKIPSYLREGTFNSIKKDEVMYDLALTSVDGVDFKLSDLLKTKKMIIIDFYYNGCGNCRTEAPTFVEFYNTHKNDLAVVCFNTGDSKESIIAGKTSIFGYPDDFYLVEDRTTQNFLKFNVTAAPTKFFLDSGGYVCEMVAGGMSEAMMKQIVEENLFETPRKEAAANTGSVRPVLLPRRKIFEEA